MSASVPAWPVLRLRYLASINPPVEARGLDPDQEVTFLPLECVWPGENLDTSRTRRVREVASGFTRFLEGDVLLPKITPTFEAGRSAIAEGLRPGAPGFGTTELHVLRAGSRLHPRFLYYRTLAQDFLSLGTGEMTGVAGQQRVPTDFVRNFRVHVPPLSEQSKVVAFLDRECAHMDRLSQAKSRLIARLEEKRVAARQNLVLRGLDQDAPVKPSGLPTIGEVPAHWALRQNKTLFREVAELSGTGDEELLTVSHLTGVTPRSEKDVNMFLAESHVGYKRCRPGDLIINTMWAWMGALGVTSYTGIVSPAYGVYRLHREHMLPAYYHLLYRTPAYVAEMTRYSKGIWSSRLRLYPETFLSLKTLLPPMHEQVAIVDAVERVDRPLLALRETLEESVRVLHHRRRALITAAVTGAIDTSTYGRVRAGAVA
jgi:type I restriction enzyme, S subunit